MRREIKLEEPNYMTVQELKDELAKYPDYMPVVGVDDEFITTTEHDTIALEDGIGLYEFGVVRIC